MIITQVHNFYTQAGGESKVLEEERLLLEKNGHGVTQFTKSSNSIDTFSKKINALINIAFSKNTYNEFISFCKKTKPDIIHVHNTFPLITPSIFYAARNLNIPIVYTLHNYRLIYPNALLLHNGEIDNRTIKGSSYKTIPQKVYKDSYIQTAALAYLIEHHRKRRTWQNKVNRFIALTNFAKNKFIEAGLPASRFCVKPNFVKDPFVEYPNLIRSTDPKGFLFIGRISEEKGIKDLIDTWIEYNLSIPLYILGDGPLKLKLESKSQINQNIKWIGSVDKKEVYFWLARVKALIFPSIWYEGFPMTITEALAIGTPVITSNIGSQQSIIKDGVSGLHFEVSDKGDLKDKVVKLNADDELVLRLSSRARQEYLNKYTLEKNYEMLMEIYEEVISKK